MLGGLPLVFLHLTNIPVTIGATLVPIGYVLFAWIMVSGFRAKSA
jgi:hypothetical protein